MFYHTECFFLFHKQIHEISPFHFHLFIYKALLKQQSVDQSAVQ